MIPKKFRDDATMGCMFWVLLIHSEKWQRWEEGFASFADWGCQEVCEPPPKFLLRAKRDKEEGGYATRGDGNRRRAHLCPSQNVLRFLSAVVRHGERRRMQDILRAQMRT